MTQKKRKNENAKDLKKGTQVCLRSALVGGAITLALTLNTLPVLNLTKNEGKELHNENVNYSMQAERVAEQTSRESSRAGKINYNLPGLPSLKTSSHTALSVRISGQTQSFSALRMNGIVYLPLEKAVKAVNSSARVSYNTSSRTSTVSATGLYLSVTHGGYVMYANDRPLFSFTPAVVMNDGYMYVPASALTKALGLSFSVSSNTLTVSGNYKPLLPATKFYREDEVYWLSKIISAESSGESLLGQIAVGDVILNRVKSSLFPNTIYSVIFDRKYGVQFSPTADGRIYQNPTYTATLAAKICLEGISLSDNAMYFLNPRAAQSNWIIRNRPYLYTIGNHDFYG